MSRSKNKLFAVIGLGRFGMSILQTLSEYNVEVLACDNNPAKVQLAAEYATHVVQADVTQESAIVSMGLGNFDVVLLCMGEDFEASLMATMMIKEQGADYIVVKALGDRQKKILESIGADYVILPEREMGKKLARSLIESNIMDVLENTGHYKIQEMKPHLEWVGKTILESDIRAKYNVNILAVQRDNKMIIPVTSDLVLEQDDILITISNPERNNA